MALNPVAFTAAVVDDFLRYQLTTYPLADVDLYAQMGELPPGAIVAAYCARLFSISTVAVLEIQAEHTAHATMPSLPPLGLDQRLRPPTPPIAPSTAPQTGQSGLSVSFQVVLC